MILRTTPLLFAAALVAACQQSSPSASSGAPSASVSAAPARPARGLGAEGSDDAVVALAKAALECEWTASGLQLRCPEYKAFADDAKLRDGGADATLVNMLEDGQEKVRWLGARGLMSKGKVYRTDKALAARVMAAAKAEKSPAVATVLATAVARVEAEATGTVADMQALMTSHEVAEMRRGVINNALFLNKGLYDLLRKLAVEDPDAKIRCVAVGAFWVGAPRDKTSEVCALWLDRVKSDGDKDVQGQSAYMLSFWSRGCVAEWDPLLDLLEQRAADGAVGTSQLASALAHLHGQKGSSPAQKKRALAIARKVVETKANDPKARGSALRFIGEADSGGLAFAKRFEKDEEFFVRSAAERILHPDRDERPASSSKD